MASVHQTSANRGWILTSEASLRIGMALHFQLMSQMKKVHLVDNMKSFKRFFSLRIIFNYLCIFRFVFQTLVLAMKRMLKMERKENMRTVPKRRISSTDEG